METSGRESFIYGESTSSIRFAVVERDLKNGEHNPEHYRGIRNSKIMNGWLQERKRVLLALTGVFIPISRQ